MAGGLMQLTVYGTQDIFLTGTPQITFFRMVYRRHTNFALEPIQQHFIGEANFGQETSSVIEKAGDLMNRVYIEIELPKVDLAKNFTNWNVDRDTAKHQVEISKKFYDLVNQYITANTDVARKLDILLRTNNISMDDIEKTINDPRFVGQLETLKKQLQIYIANSSDLDNFDTLKNARVELVQEINGIHLPTLFNMIIINVDLLNSTSEEKNILKRKNLINLISNRLYDQMRIFYMKAYEPYQQSQEIYQQIIDGTYAERYKFAWVEEIGHSIIDQIELRIGSQIIDKHTGDWLILYNKLFLKEYQVENYYKMIGNVKELTIFDDTIKNSYKLIIPLQFWFCRNSGLSLPLIALRYHDIMFTLRLKDLAKLCYVEDDSAITDMTNIQSQYNINIMSAKLYVDYIYLETDERRRFGQSTHEYLVELVQFQNFDNINGSQYTARPDFSHPTKYVIWFAQPKKYRENLTGHNKCQWNNFGTNPNKTGYSMKSSYLRINSYNRTDPDLDMKYYNYLQPYWYFNRSPTDGFNVYSFAIEPTLHQPSSTLNMGRIDDFSIVTNFTDSMVELSKDNGEEVDIYMGVYAVYYNIFRIIGGMGGLAFQNVN
jgi:hypothetical protein